MNKYQEELKKNKARDKDFAARYLASIGSEFDEGINERMDDLVSQNKGYPVFYLAIAESLIWADYAVRKPEYFKLCAKYYQDDDLAIFDKVGDFSGRFDDQKRLKDALTNWKKILKQTSDKVPGNKSSISEIMSFQQSIKQTVESIKTRGRMAFGAWLLTGPFKIVACYRNDWWKENKLDKLLLPIGSQVEKGIRFLKKEKFIEASPLLKSIGYEDFSSSMASLERIQDFEKELAKIANSRVLHINSGLHLIGSKSNKCL